MYFASVMLLFPRIVLAYPGNTASRLTEHIDIVMPALRSLWLSGANISEHVCFWNIDMLVVIAWATNFGSTLVQRRLGADEILAIFIVYADFPRCISCGPTGTSNAHATFTKHVDIMILAT